MDDKHYIMALDQGTTSSRCIIFDKEGNICGMQQKEFSQIYPQPGWVEHNPKEIWSSQLSVAVECMALSGIGPEKIDAVGITNQRETCIIWWVSPTREKLALSGIKRQGSRFTMPLCGSVGEPPIL